MSGKGKTAFRPVTEAIEGRILAAAGQAWVEIANQSGRNLSFQISFNEGRTYSNESLRNGASTFAHVNRNDPDVLIRLRGASPVVLATGPSKQAAPSYTITPTNAGGMTVAPCAGFQLGRRLDRKGCCCWRWGRCWCWGVQAAPVLRRHPEPVGRRRLARFHEQ